MPNYNNVTLMGNLTRDIELRHTQSGLAIGKFGLAVNETSGKGDNKKTKTTFVDITAFGKTAEILKQYVCKGSPLFISGRLNFSQWEDQSGQKRSKLDVICDQFQFLGSKKDDSPRDDRPTNDDIPF